MEDWLGDLAKRGLGLAFFQLEYFFKVSQKFRTSSASAVVISENAYICLDREGLDEKSSQRP